MVRYTFDTGFRFYRFSRVWEWGKFDNISILSTLITRFDLNLKNLIALMCKQKYRARSGESKYEVLAYKPNALGRGRSLMAHHSDTT